MDMKAMSEMMFEIKGELGNISGKLDGLQCKEHARKVEKIEGCVGDLDKRVSALEWLNKRSSKFIVIIITAFVAMIGSIGGGLILDSFRSKDRPAVVQTTSAPSNPTPTSLN